MTEKVDPLKKEIRLEASLENLDPVQAFIEEQLEAAGCPIKAQMQIGVAVEEIFVNIAQYAYAPGSGEAVVCVESSEEARSVTIRFADRGVPYDPLARQDPDITLPAEQRDVGGLGVFMTKKLMDEMSYEYRDGQNVLTMKKSW